jgi:hypothetical protein
MTMINNLQDALNELTPHDKQEVETFIGYLKLRATQNPQPATLVERVNTIMLKDYVKLTIDMMDFNDDFTKLEIYFVGRDRPVSFNLDWFVENKSEDPLFYDEFMDRFEELYVKYRLGSNRIDKVAIPAKYLSELGKKEGKKTILALEEIKNVAVPLTAAALNQTITFDTNQTSSQLVSNPFVAPKVQDLITASASKFHSMFSDLGKFAEGRVRLARVAEIMVNFIDKLGSKRYSWDSEFFYGCKHDFTDITGISGQTIDIKAHFHPHDRLQLSEFTLKNVDADVILSVLVEETDAEYKVTICGWIKKDDFIAKTKPWNYNEQVVLRSMELHELNDAKDLFS